jgi:hypothetical protein
VSREFHPHKIQFFYLFIKTLPCYQKYICGRLLNTNKDLMKLLLRLALARSDQDQFVFHRKNKKQKKEFPLVGPVWFEYVKV